MPTFLELQQDCYARCGYATSPATEVMTRFKRYLNETQRDLFSMPGTAQWLTGVTTFASVADQMEYAYPAAIARLLSVRDQDNRISLQELSFADWRAIQPDPTTPTGTPSHVVQLGQSGVERQPADAGTLYVVSTSAADTGTAYLEGTRQGGYPFTTSVAMTGTSSVAFPYADIESVSKFYLSQAADGTVTLRDEP